MQQRVIAYWHCLTQICMRLMARQGCTLGLAGSVRGGGVFSGLCFVTSTTSTRCLHVIIASDQFKPTTSSPFHPFHIVSTILSRLIMAPTAIIEVSTDNEAGKGQQDEVSHAARWLSF